MADESWSLMMTPERWQRIEEIFQAALERDPAERDTFLRENCAGDESLRKEVETLIFHEQQRGRFIEAAVEKAANLMTVEQALARERERIGPYKLIRQIGRGGMGSVYLAARDDDEYKKRVAIKLIRRGMDSEDILRRFRNERQILAGLDHPNIARLLDGGTTEDNLPYFVMEYVEGKPLNDYSDAHRLSTAERLKLFRQVCSAVHYAHQNLVVHRDLKPSNILVTADGTPKLLDFGIAKVLNPEMSAQTIAPTATVMRLMTPEYASPEQVRGDQITTASDVYSLGVLLFELLTGHRPYRVSGSAPHEIIRIVCEQEPGKPSTAISRLTEAGSEDKKLLRAESGKIHTRRGATQAGGTIDPKLETAKLRRQLEGDLDNIVLMAMRKEPQRRYSSVEQLSEDLRRHLEGLPVIARKDTFAYRAGKFVRRHRAGVVAAALIIVILIAGVIVTIWQASVASSQRAIAEQRFNDVRKLANSLVFRLHDEIADLPGSTRARQTLVEMALEYLDALAKEARGDASLQAELASAYEKVGDVQGSPSNANLGDSKGALASYQKAREIRETLVESNPADLNLRRNFARNLLFISDLQSQTGDTPAALTSLLQALSLYEALTKEDPKDVDTRSGQATCHGAIGRLLLTMGDARTALEHQQKAQAIREALAAEAPKDAKLRRNLAVSSLWLALTLGETGNLEESVNHWRRAVAGFEAIAAEDPTNASARRDLLSSYNGLGEALKRVGDLDGALERLRKALSLAEELAAADQRNIVPRGDIAHSLKDIGSILIEKGDAEGGLRHYRRAAELYAKLSADDPANLMYSAFVGETQNGMGNALLKAGDVTGAIKHYRDSLTTFEKVSARNPTEALNRREVARSCGYLGNAYQTLASKASGNQRILNWREARSWYQKSLDVLLELSNRGALTPYDAAEPERIAAEIAKCDAALTASK